MIFILISIVQRDSFFMTKILQEEDFVDFMIFINQNPQNNLIKDSVKNLLCLIFRDEHFG